MATGSEGGRDWQGGGRRDGYNWSHKQKATPVARGDEDRNRRGRGSPAHASSRGQGRGRGGQRPASDHRDGRGGHDSSMRNWTPGERRRGQSQPAGGYQDPPGRAPRDRPQGGAPPSPGDSEIELLANHFAIEVLGGAVYHYDVAISSMRRAQGEAAGAAQGDAVKPVPCLIPRINRQVIASLERTNPTTFNSRPVFDGRSNLYTREKIRPDDRPNHSFSVTVTGDGRQRHYAVEIRLAAQLNLDALHALNYRSHPVPQNAIQALDIIMRHGPCTTFPTVGRSLFPDPGWGGDVSLGAVVTLRFGYYASVRPAEKTLMLNIDRSAMAFYKSPRVVKFMADLLKERYRDFNLAQLTDDQLTMLSSELRAVRVRGTHRPIQYRVAEVTRLPARDITFTRTLADGTTQLVSVASYFEDRYPGKMQNKMLPCIRAGSLERPVYLPIEVCEIVEWQPYRKKLSASMTKIMIKRTAQPPRARFVDIQTSVLDLVDRGTPYLDAFGISVGTTATRLTGRLLSAPRLAFEADRAQEPRDGTWYVPSNRLLHAKPLEHWALLKCGCKPGLNTTPLVAEFQHTGPKLGMRVVPPLAQEIAEVTRASILQQLTRLQKRFPKLSLVVVLLGEGAPYAVIKEVAEVTLGIRTQCILEANAAGPNSRIKSIVANLCLKINAKLGGVNNGLMDAERRQCFSDTFFIGADVTHPAPGDRDKPSIAACVGSMDDVPAQYRASIRIQMQSKESVARVEIITDLQVMVQELLRAYQTKTGKKPKEIFFYRDGVSEGQFSSVLDEELPAIQAACRAVALPKPAITFIVVQKRHHTRFKRYGAHDQCNIPPGTVVDKVVTHPQDNDFFLCSHLGIQGTSRPARYVVLHDDNKHTLNFLQRLSYQLCHTYARCRRSVSIPAPVYYAHLAAFRAKEHITAAYVSCASPRNYGKAVAVAEALQDVMYFV